MDYYSALYSIRGIDVVFKWPQIPIFSFITIQCIELKHFFAKILVDAPIFWPLIVSVQSFFFTQSNFRNCTNCKIFKGLFVYVRVRILCFYVEIRMPCFYVKIIKCLFWSHLQIMSIDWIQSNTWFMKARRSIKTDH